MIRSVSILLLFFGFLLLSCSTTIDGNIKLKDLSKDIFTLDSSYKVAIKDSIATYRNTNERLPNSEFSKFYIKKHPDEYLPYFNITVNLSIEKKITIKGVEFFEEEVVDYLNEFIDFASEGKPAMIHLNFDENLSFQDYLEFRQLINPIQKDKISINKKVFIYDINLLPDCDCTL